MVIKIEGFDVLIDDEDFEKVSSLNWKLLKDKNSTSNGRFYFKCHLTSRKLKFDITYLLHRYVMGCVKNDGKVIDHINGNTLDNRKSNLRSCTQQQNIRNCKRPKTNTSGYKGVSRDKRIKKWVASIHVDDRKIHIGCFRCPTAAWFAYVRAARELHGEFARFK